MSRPILTIANEKESEFEFEVSIQGVPAHEANVRFVIEGGKYDTTINCVANPNNKWLARIPSMRLDESAKNFRVEVIAGGYYFCPTQGGVKITSSPRVKIAEVTQRAEPSKVMVSASFTEVDAQPQIVMMESMSQTTREALFKRCRAAGQIFSRAAGLMAEAANHEPRKITSQSLVDILEAVKKAVKMVEVKVYL